MLKRDCNIVKKISVKRNFHNKFLSSASSATDCTLLMSDIDSIRCWCAANCNRLIIDKNQVIIFTRTTN